MDVRDILKIYSQFRTIDKFVKKVTTNQLYLDYRETVGKGDSPIPSIKDEIYHVLTFYSNEQENHDSFYPLLTDYNSPSTYEITDYPYSGDSVTVSIDVKVEYGILYYSIIFSLRDRNRKGNILTHTVGFNNIGLLEEYLALGIGSFERLYKDSTLPI